jgi:ABC-type antimicrobial peptide transport system permease subunit
VADTNIIDVVATGRERFMSDLRMAVRHLVKSPGFGSVALLLACVGLYGLMSHAVLRRTGEIGLRMALGALPGHVLRTVLGECLLLVGLGILTGLAAALGAGRLIASMLFGVTPADPLTYGVVAVILVVVTLLAALGPARRASRLDPVVALKVE